MHLLAEHNAISKAFMEVASSGGGLGTHHRNMSRHTGREEGGGGHNQVYTSTHGEVRQLLNSSTKAAIAHRHENSHGKQELREATVLSGGRFREDTSSLYRSSLSSPLPTGTFL